MLACMSPAPVPVPPPAPPSLKRPRGLWKQRRAQAANHSPTFVWPNKELASHADSHLLREPLALFRPQPSLLGYHLCSPSSASSRRSLSRSLSERDSDVDSDDDDPDLDDARSHSSVSSYKRRRISGHFSSPSDAAPSSVLRSAAGSLSPPSDAHKCDVHPSRSSPTPTPPVLAATPMSYSISRSVSNASSFSLPPPKDVVHSADYEDWENLKELFARAAERYDGASLLSRVRSHRGAYRPQPTTSPRPCLSCAPSSASATAS